MTDSRQRQPARDETPHTIPEDVAVLAAPGQRAMPEPTNAEPKNRQRRCFRQLDLAPFDRLIWPHPAGESGL